MATPTHTSDDGRTTRVDVFVQHDGAIVVEVVTDYEPSDHMRLWINDDCAFIGKPHEA